MNKLIEYIAGAIRYASEETGLKDFSGFILLLNDMFVRPESIIGLPVYVIPLGVPLHVFALAYHWDPDTRQQRAMKAVLEYQELYLFPEDGKYGSGEGG